MIRMDMAMSEARRMAGLDFFPSAYLEAVAEIAKALATAKSETELTAFVDDWLRRQTRCPKPAEIREALRHDAPLAEPCGRCEEGWIVTPNGAVACECRKGDARA